MLDLIGFCKSNPDIHLVVRSSDDGNVTITMGNQDFYGVTGECDPEDPVFLDNMKYSLDCITNKKGT